VSELTWQGLRDADFASMSDAASLWQSYIEYATTTVVDLPEEIKILSEAGEDDFDGPVAEAARGYIMEVVEVFEEDLADRATRIKTFLEDAKGDFETQQAALSDLISEAGGDLLPEGGVGEERFKVLRSFASDHHQAEVTDEQRSLYERAEALSTEFKAIMAEARRIDDDLAAELDKLDDSAPAMPPVVGEPGFAERNGEYLREKHQDFLNRVEDGEASPAEITGWWNSMSEEERALFVATAPDLIGPLDGIPTEDRDTANRDLLDEEITDLDAQIARVEAELANTRENLGRSNNPRYTELMNELETLQGQRDSLNNLNNQIAEPMTAEDANGGAVSADYYLLGYDSAGDGQAIVSVGNPDTAENVNVYVPGTKADLDSLNGDLSRAEGTFADAARWGPPGSSTASILWLGYDAPDEVQPSYDGDNEGWEPGASSEKYAMNAADDLSSFVDGLRATDQGSTANLTMSGHSYGSTTIGVAARENGLDVDNMIFVGSPGTGAEHASDLRIDPENVWASLNEGDVIGYAREIEFGADHGAISAGFSEEDMIHGTDPTSEAFGGRTFHSEQGDGNAIDDHGAYYEQGNPARENMAFIITGQSEKIAQ
jgi:pimeloyl-ACP methyl ester carboxylesterase